MGIGVGNVGDGETGQDNSFSLSLVISAVTGAQADAGTSLAAGKQVNPVPPAASMGFWPEPSHYLGMLSLAVGRWDREGLPLSNSQATSYQDSKTHRKNIGQFSPHRGPVAGATLLLGASC